MHARHRSPGNGYRSSSMGMGMSPAGSTRGHLFYSSEYRSFNRGFGHGQGQPKSFHQPALAPRRGDIFMEAGRLAAEYLVSQGLLPPSILSGKWQNVTLRSQDGDSVQLPSEGRSSALSRLGNSVSDMDSDCRRYPADYNSMGLKSYLKGRRKGGSFRSYGSDWGREYGRSGLWSERNNVSPDMEGNDDSYAGHPEEQHVDKDIGGGLQKSGSAAFVLKCEEAGVLESELGNYNNHEEIGSGASSSSAGKDLLLVTDGEFSKKSVDITNINAETREPKDSTCKDETQKQDDAENSSIKSYSEEEDTLSKSNTDLLALCKFAKVPSRTRSSLSYKSLKVDSITNNDGENISDIKLARGSKILVEDGSLNSSAVDKLSNKTHDSKFPDSEISSALAVQSVEGVGALGSISGVDQGKCTRSQSFPDRVLMHDNEQKSTQELLGLQKSSSMVIERGEKRSMEENDTGEGTKKLREWFPSMVARADEYFGMCNLSEKKAISPEEMAVPGEKVALAFNQESSVNNYQFPNAQEKQLFPGSFKICDLNLMESSDLNENHHNDPTLIYPSIPEKEATPVDVGLSMSNSSMSSQYRRQQSNCKEIEVIDLENDSSQEDKTNDTSERKTETMFPGLENFPNSSQNDVQIPDYQDNYNGLMITQLLNNFPDCPPVPGVINPLHNEMALHNGEGALADVDSIYMSLGEIPLSFLRGWEQPPPQGYEKPF